MYVCVFIIPALRPFAASAYLKINLRHKATALAATAA